MTDFRNFIKAERERIEQALAAIEAKRAALEEEAETLHSELVAVEAYEAAKEGRLAPKAKPRSRRTGIKDEMMKVIRGHQAGIARADLLEKMGVKGDKSAEQSVSNALANAKKKGELEQTGDGRYKVLPTR